MISSPDIDRTRRDAVAALQSSRDVARRAVAAVCRLEDAAVAPLLLAWLLQQDFRSGVEEQEEREGRKSGGRHDIEIERMVLSLPYSTTNDVRVRAALQSNTSVCLRGDLVARLLCSRAKDGKEARLGQALQGLSARDAAALLWLYACAKWSVKR